MVNCYVHVENIVHVGKPKTNISAVEDVAQRGHLSHSQSLLGCTVKMATRHFHANWGHTVLAGHKQITNHAQPDTSAKTLSQNQNAPVEITVHLDPRPWLYALGGCTVQTQPPKLSAKQVIIVLLAQLDHTNVLLRITVLFIQSQ
jgi:hypothetical protein